MIIEESASTSGRPKKKLPGVDVLRAEKKEMTFSLNVIRLLTFIFK